MSPDIRSRRAAAGARGTVWLGLLTAGCLLAVGCQGLEAPLSVQREAELRERALALLLRAAQSDLGVERAHAIEALVDLAPRENLLVFRAAATSDVPVVRYAACVALGEVRDSASLSALRRMISDPNPHVRLGAAFAACRCGDREAARRLVQALNGDPDEKLRAQAAYLIGKLGEPQAVRRLQVALAREKSAHARLHIVTALALLGDRDALDALVYYAQSDLNSRLIALQSLAELAPPEAREALLRTLKDDEYYLQARLIAARALGALGDDAGYQLARKALGHSARNPEETMQVRVNAALALGAIGKPAALPALARLAESEDDPRTQVAACYAICQITRATRRQ